MYKDGTSKLSKAHVHLPFPEEQGVDAIVQEMKELSKSTTTPIPQIYSDGIAKARTLSLDIHMPPFESLKTTLYRLRADCFPKVSSNPLEIVLNNEFCLTLNNQNFLLVDKVYTLPSQTVKRLIVFGTTENLRVLSSSSLWLMDGTFSRVPRGWTQLFTIHSCVGGKVIPLIYALLMNKCRRTYCELFSSLKSVAIDNNSFLAPECLVMDCESGSLPAIRAEFSSTNVHGCFFFHFCSNINKWVITHGYITLYKSNECVRNFFREAMAIPFLPYDRIQPFFESFVQTHRAEDMEGMESAAQQSMITQFASYFVSTWIPLSREISVYGRTIRTNNHLEGWHSGLSKALRAEPGFCAFVEHLKKEQAITESVLRNIEHGGDPRPKKKAKYAKLDFSKVNALSF